jgi:nucleoside-diphosphate-sugar epimerase
MALDPNKSGKPKTPKPAGSNLGALENRSANGCTSRAAEGIVRATEQYEDMDILNLGSGEGCSVRELAETIRELLDGLANFPMTQPGPMELRARFSMSRK